MQKLNPVCASKADFAAFITANEGVVADAFEKKRKFLAANFNNDEEILLDELDAKTAAETLMEVQDRYDTIMSMLPAKEGADARVNGFIDKYLNSDRTKMIDYYRDEIKTASTSLEVNALIDQIENDIRKMKDFVEGRLTFEAFFRWLLSFQWLAFMGVGFGLIGLIGGGLVVSDRYDNLDRIRNKTKQLLPGMEQVLKMAKSRYNALANGKK